MAIFLSEAGQTFSNLYTRLQLLEGRGEALSLEVYTISDRRCHNRLDTGGNIEKSREKGITLPSQKHIIVKNGLFVFVLEILTISIMQTMKAMTS